MPRPVALKRNAGQEMEVIRWIVAVVGESWPAGNTYEDGLKNGVLLCKMMNIISPGSVPTIHTTGSGFKLMENIAAFHRAMEKYGVDKADIFQTNDLYEHKDMAAVTNTMYALDRAVGKHGDWTGPRLDAGH